MNVDAYLSSRGLKPDSLLKQGVEIELEPDPHRAKERLGGNFAPGVEAVFWFPLNQAGGWLALPLPGAQGPCCRSDHHPWVYIPAFTRNCQDSAPIYLVSDPLAATVRIQAGQAAVALNRHWHAALTKNGEQSLREDLQQLVFRRKVRIVSRVDIGVRERQQLIQLFLLLLAAAVAEVEICWTQDGEEHASKPFLGIFTAIPADLSLVKETLKQTYFTDYSIFIQACQLLAERTRVPIYELKQLKPRREIVQQEVRTLTPWPQDVDGYRLLEAIYYQIRKYVWMTDEQARAVSLWVVASYLIDRLELFPILFITSPVLSCGKTILCKVIARLAADPFITTDLSAAGFYHTIDTRSPTLIVDEAKNFFQLDRRLHRLINGSYIRESARVHIKAGREVREYRTFGPKVLSLIGELPADTASRTIRINMVRKPKELELAEIMDSSSAEWFDLRSQVLRWVLDNEFAPPQIREGGFDRYRDNWRSLLSVADASGWAEGARLAYQALSESYLEDDPNNVLLARIKEIFDRRDTEFLTSTALVSELNKDPSAWWYRLSEQKLARFFRAFHIRPEQHRLGRAGTRGGGRGYWRLQLDERVFTHL
jgi:uncharacterized protein DUF3631